MKIIIILYDNNKKMKLQDKFFKSFFYSFFISVITCTLAVTTFLGLFTNNN